MDNLLIQMIQLADKLDRKNAKKAVEMLDSCIKTAGLIKEAQYVGIQGYWLKQERCFINCYNAKRRKSSGKASPQECFFDCLDEYQEAMVDSVETDSWSKYAQVSPSTPGQGDAIQGINTGTVGGHVASGKEIIEKLEKIQEKRKASKDAVKVSEVKNFFKEAKEYETEAYINKMHEQLREELVQIGDLLDKESMFEESDVITKVASMSKEAQWLRSLKRTIEDWGAGAGWASSATGKRIKMRFDRLHQDVNEWFGAIRSGAFDPKTVKQITQQYQKFVKSLSELAKINLPVAQGKGTDNKKQQQQGQQPQQGQEQQKGTWQKMKDWGKEKLNKTKLQAPEGGGNPFPAEAGADGQMSKEAQWRREPVRILQDIMNEIRGLYTDIGQIGTETQRGREKLPEAQKQLANMQNAILGAQQIAMQSAEANQPKPENAEEAAVANEEAQQTGQDPQTEQVEPTKQVMEINEILRANPAIIDDVLKHVKQYGAYSGQQSVPKQESFPANL